MRGLICAAAVVLALGLAACGGDDETTTPSDTQGAASGDGMTAGEFIDASIPDEVAAVQEAAEAAPECSGANTDAGSDFQVQVAIDAAQADPGTPLSEIVAGAC